MSRTIRNTAILLAMSFASFSAFAWDGTASGKISLIETVGGGAGAPGNYDTRVYLTGTATMCGSVHAWAYVNANDGNYKGILANILTAKAMGLNVILYTTREATGYCRLGFMAIS